jgi:hypothetical protein
LDIGTKKHFLELVPTSGPLSLFDIANLCLVQTQNRNTLNFHKRSDILSVLEGAVADLSIGG